MRVVNVFTTRGKAGSIETSANTVEDLTEALAVANIDPSGMKLVLGETKTVLTPASVLPTEDFKLYLVPQKTKSGRDASDIYEDLAEAHDNLAQYYRELAETGEFISSEKEEEITEGSAEAAEIAELEDMDLD